MNLAVFAYAHQVWIKISLLHLISTENYCGRVLCHPGVSTVCDSYHFCNYSSWWNEVRLLMSGISECPPAQHCSLPHTFILHGFIYTHGKAARIYGLI